MKEQIPYFMPMYPPNNFNELINKINLLEKKIQELENRITNLEKVKLMPLKNDYTSFQDGYMV